MTQQERFAAMFAAIDDDGRRYVLAVLKGEYDRMERKRQPVLRVIPGGAQSAPARASTRHRGQLEQRRGAHRKQGLAMNDQPKLRAIDGGSMTPEEADLLCAFRAMESRGRSNALSAVQALERVFGRARPTLTLVPTSRHGGAR